MTDQSDYVARIFNEMAGEYDNLRDPWYSYTFAEIERVLRREFRPAPGGVPKPVALDVGCGTGIQSLILAELGYQVEGVDIAGDLIAIAESKLHGAGFTNTHFHRADATSLPFQDSIADVINCCGPTLSFIPDWRAALREISRCLKPGGKLLLEVEGKWTLDLLWEAVSALTGNSLGYDTSLKASLKQFAPPWTTGHRIDYPFRLESGETVTMPLKLFTVSELNRELESLDLIPGKRRGFHVITNLFPSTALHNADAGQFVRSAFNGLADIERLVNGAWPFNALACSLLITATRKG